MILNFKMTWIIFDFMVIVKKFHQDNIKNKKKKI
jgi:hypothetical protein